MWQGSSSQQISLILPLLRLLLKEIKENSTIVLEVFQKLVIQQKLKKKIENTFTGVNFWVKTHTQN